ncbi:antitoxin VapB [Methylomarinovum tepidoasis]|uniref:Antitoxin VapB n=1 Tax=Methylomarinovum tepidoasis TaxID=2840183 RepID=A0AAU9CDB8_9GAMM|nr:antitoxin [Methylomarinovum sp. IN45]BCX88193.1 antitoxin VapB [Methylomarinovum sp. IN45]
MKTTKVFRSGNSQAIRLPKEFRLDCDTVTIHREGRRLIIEPVEDWAGRLYAVLEDFSDDFMAEGRDHPQPQVRPELESLFDDN